MQRELGQQAATDRAPAGTFSQWRRVSQAHRSRGSQPNDASPQPAFLFQPATNAQQHETELIGQESEPDEEQQEPEQDTLPEDIEDDLVGMSEDVRIEQEIYRGMPSGTHPLPFCPTQYEQLFTDAKA